MSKINVKSVQKEIGKLEKELEQKRGILALLGGKTAGPKRAAKKASRTKTPGRDRRNDPRAKPARERSTKRYVTAEHLEIVAEAIGERLPAIELKSKIDGRTLRAMPLKQVIAALRKKGRLTSEGQKRQLVYIRTTPPVGAVSAPSIPEEAPAEAPPVPQAEA